MKQICIMVLLICVCFPVTADSSHILIDTGHGGYPIQEEMLVAFETLAQEQGFQVTWSSIADVDLQQFSLIISANPDSSFSSEDSARIDSYLEGGGVFFLLGSGDYDNRDHSHITNSLLQDLRSTIRCNDEQLEDTINCGKPYIPLFSNWNPHPLTANLPPISLFSAQSLICGPTAYPLLVGNSSTYGRNLDDTPPLSYQGPAVVLAVEKRGRGTLLVGGSWGFLCGPTYQGHAAFMKAVLSYVHENRCMISCYEEQFRGSKIHIGESCRMEVDGRAADIMREYLGEITSGNSQTSVIIGGPQVNRACKVFNRYLPVTFKKDSSWYLQRGETQYHGQEYGLIACLHVEGQEILIIAGVGGTGTMGALKVATALHDFVQIPLYNQYGEVLLVQVNGDENCNGIEEKSESWILTLL
jgi:hypothetical protein